MRSLVLRICPVLLLCLVCLSDGRADQVVLTSGERFSSSHIWEENGKIKFNMHGLMVSVNKSDVAEIIRSGVAATPPSARSTPSPQPAADLQTPTFRNRINDPPAGRSDDPQARAASPAQKTEPLIEASSAVSKEVGGTGLKDIFWQMTPKDIPGLKKIQTDPAYGGIDEYWRPDESPALGSALLDGMIYRFWRNRLYSVMIWVAGRPGYKRLRSAVTERYGQGRPNKAGLERFVWTDKTTDRMLEFDEELNTGIFWMRSQVLNARVKQIYSDH